MKFQYIEQINARLNVNGVVEGYVGGVCRKLSEMLSQHLLYPVTHRVSPAASMRNHRVLSKTI